MVIRRRYSSRAPLLMVILIIALFTACSTHNRGIQVLYQTETGKRLPASAVARISMQDLESLEKVLLVNYDTPENIHYADTLEILPGHHKLALFQVMKRSSLREKNLVPTSSYFHACLRFDFEAKSGHLYEFKLVEMSFDTWKVDLIDQSESGTLIHGVACPPVKRGSWLYN